MSSEQFLQRINENRCCDRMTSKGKERIISSHLLHMEDLLPYASKPFFQDATRSYEGLRLVRLGCLGGRHHRGLPPTDGYAIHFAVGGQRQARKLDHAPWYHIVRELRSQVIPQ